MDINEFLKHVRDTIVKNKETLLQSPMAVANQQFQQKVAQPVAQGFFNNYIYNKEKDRVAPSGALWNISDMAQSMADVQSGKITKEQYNDKISKQSFPILMQLIGSLKTSDVPLGMKPKPQTYPSTNYIGGVEHGTPIRTGSIHTPGTPNQKKIIELMIYDEKGNKVGSRVYQDTVSAQKAYERIVVPNNGNLLVRELDEMPIKPSGVGGEIGGVDVGGKTFYHGTYAGNKFTTFDTSKMGHGVGSNAYDQGNQIYLTETPQTAEWFSKQATKMKTGEFNKGEVLPFTFKKGSKMLEVADMPRGYDLAQKVIDKAKADGYDAISFPDKGFNTIEGDPSIIPLYKGDTPPKSIIVINRNAISSGEIGGVKKPTTETELMKRIKLELTK